MWVEGVVRVVCGLSLETSCQDVVIALAQAIGQTGRYILIQKLRGVERQLVAEDCPLQSLAQTGQLVTEVQFILRRTGPSLSDKSNGSVPKQLHFLPRYLEPEPPKHREPQKALSFNLGPSTFPRRTKPKAWSPRASPELRASSIPPLLPQSDPSKEEIFRQVLQQQERLQAMEVQLKALEREADYWEMQVTPAPGLTPGQEKELGVLELRLRQNQTELADAEFWEEQLQVESNTEQDMQRRLDQLRYSLDDHSFRLQDLQANTVHLEQVIQQEAHHQSTQPAKPRPEEALVPLKEELHHRLQQGKELDALLIETEEEQQLAEAKIQESGQEMEELNKELRQCDLQQFILQTAVPPAPSYTGLPQPNPPHPLPIATPYLYSAGILEDDQSDSVTVC